MIIHSEFVASQISPMALLLRSLASQATMQQDSNPSAPFFIFIVEKTHTEPTPPAPEMDFSLGDTEASEFIVAAAETETGEVQEVILLPQLDVSGSLAWTQSLDAEHVNRMALARSQMGSMLLDSDRNHSYERGIIAAVKQAQERLGRPPRGRV